MPELPEVETVVRGLRKILEGRTFARVRSHTPASSVIVSRSLRQRKLETILPGRIVQGISRRGKNILVFLSGGIALWVHLKMTGKFRYVEKLEPRDKHDLVLFDLAAKANCPADLQLRFHDLRRFGRLRLFPCNELWSQPGLVDLGPEPLEITAQEFVTLCRARTRMIKPALLDQSFIAGIGNIYADESLHLSRIHPTRTTSTLSPKKLTALHGHIQHLLHKSIRMLGTTVVNYAGVDGNSGSFQKLLRVYGREGEPCRFCGRKIVRERIGSRSAHFCPRCQRRRQVTRP